MSDATRLYTVILGALLTFLPAMLAENRSTLAMLITGMLRMRSGQLKKAARGVQYGFKKESLVERFRRWVRNKNVVVGVEYQVGACLCLMVSVYYKGRALPLAWVTYKGRKGHSSQATQLTLFRAVQALLPPSCAVVLVGDGEFDGAEVVEWFQTDAHWQYVCRTSETTLVGYEGQWIPLTQLPVTSGQDAFFTDLVFTQEHQVPHVNLLVVWHATEKRHWFFVTNVQTQVAAQAWYRKRFTTETLFSDWKDRGFHLDDTALKAPDRVNRLILAASIAYVLCITLGVQAILSGDYRQLVRKDTFYHSLFQLGLIYLEHLLNEFLHFPPLLNLPPPESFEHTLIKRSKSPAPT
jgi:hypothetical protein